MCGRYDLSETGRTLRIGDVELVLTGTRPRYNVSPLQTAPVIRRREGELFVEDLRWGLVPAWATDATFASKCINARSETVADKPMFRTAFRKRRCIVPADGYFEWQKGPAGKLPWRFVRRDHRPLLLAGLWESWIPPDSADGQALKTFTILTAAANQDTSEVHERMPLVLDQDSSAVWLDAEAGHDRILALCASPATGALDRYRVDTVVNNSRNDVPECVQPLSAGPSDR